MPNVRAFRVLSLDGGGMRGTYTAAYLEQVAAAFARQRGADALDVGAAFDLIVGTSAGGIIACALAQGVPLATVIDLYRAHGRGIFPRPLPRRVGFGLVVDLLARPRALRRGTAALRSALSEAFGDTTLRQVYDRRGIALAITSVRLDQHRDWVFKTPHAPGPTHRDDDYTLVDLCLAASAAPLYRSLAAIDRPGGTAKAAGGYDVFVDGGLWANNPVLVGLIEALEMTEPGREIQIFCLGTRPRPAGETVARDQVDRGFAGWKFGAETMTLLIDAQEYAYDGMARKLAAHCDRDCTIVRLPCGQVTAALAPYLALDDTRPEAIDALIAQARIDGDMAIGRCANPGDREGALIRELFGAAPPPAEVRPAAVAGHTETASIDTDQGIGSHPLLR